MTTTDAPSTRRLIGPIHELREDGTRVHKRTCPLCECMCGLEVHLDDDDGVKVIRANADDVWSKGYLCPKGTVLGRLHDDPDRLRHPMIRDGETWREATWDEAFARCHELIDGVRQTYGPTAMTAFVGNPVGHSFTLGRYMAMLIGQAGFEMIYSAGTIDQWPKNVTCALMYGNQWKIPTVDIRRTDFLVVMGGNPQASGGSLMACPDVLGELDAIRERGGTVVVVDPRRTGTADRADQWVPIRPGTDAALLLAMVQVIVEEGLLDLGSVADMVDGVDDLVAAVEGFTPDAVADWCAVPAETIRDLARRFAAAERGAVYGRIGLCNQEFGTLASWLVDVVNIVTGHFDTEGGLMWGRPVNAPIAWFADTAATGEPTFGRWTSRVRGAPEVLGQVPCSCLAEEIATPGEGQIKGLITIAGNPVISVPESDRLEEALPLLDCMISVDSYLNETTRFAHVILPGPSPLETPHFDELIPAWAVGSAVKWSDALYAPPEGAVPEWETLCRLGWYCAGGTEETFDLAAIDDGWFSVLCQMTGRDPEATLALYGEGGPERMIDLMVRMGPFGDRYGEVPDGLTLARIRDQVDGIDLGPMVPQAHELVGTPSGRIQLAPEYVVGDLPRLRRAMADEPDGMVLVSRRHLRSKNSWMHNVDVLVKGKDRCTLLVHPDDAARHGLADGGRALVSSEAGQLEVPVEVSDEMMPGVVCLPHGWGHDRPGTRLSVAREHAGVNNNLLAPGTFVDELSGNAAVNGIPVELAPA
ncbi:molybdopterin-dependent oxidoreductase [Rhabdothermincola salaria]|uniref:molybdopterin-dependent oxidoreductase n=1 Tax=Rhabdothermincola salaria TaxID=2903142 RepID=UPI001E583D20|nr:molybdopterin-dependent oxidoreductase [Rhabdothermincola salaria]MCD9622435.1 molybdopterin-dependent oxidoreductase [Rhabdothermincola salaria]